MKALVLLIGLTLLCSCADVSPNYNAYLEAAKHHDTQQAMQASSTIQAIRSTTPTRGFATQAESAMFSVIQSMLIADIRYQAFGVRAPLTGYDVLDRVTVPILQLVNPWLLWWVADGGSSSNSKSGNPTYLVNGDGDLLVNSANTGSQNSHSNVGISSATTQFKSDDYCLTCDEDGNVNPVTSPVNPIECADGEMYSATCSCETYKAGNCP